MKTKIRTSTFTRKMAIENKPTASGCTSQAQPVRSWTQPTQVASDTHGSGFQPPRKRSVNTAEPTIMCEYSATKNRPHLKAPYSVWKLPTRSASDSMVSNGWRLVSA